MRNEHAALRILVSVAFGWLGCSSHVTGDNGAGGNSVVTQGGGGSCNSGPGDDGSTASCGPDGGVGSSCTGSNGGASSDGGGAPVGGWGVVGGGEPVGGFTSNDTACQDYCSTWGTCNPSSDCSDDCMDQYFSDPIGLCRDQTVAYLVCAAESFTGNCNATACTAEAQAMNQCLETVSCGNFSCSSDDASCSCQGFCSAVQASQQCYFQAGGWVDCTCFQAGAFVGECQMNGNGCNFETSCCRELLL